MHHCNGKVLYAPLIRACVFKSNMCSIWCQFDITDRVTENVGREQVFCTCDNIQDVIESPCPCRCTENEPVALGR